jgi:hypothetical protein
MEVSHIVENKYQLVYRVDNDNLLASLLTKKETTIVINVIS